MLGDSFAKMEQYASRVVNFSSQYGTAGTSSYTASNLASGLNVYPKYGDYTEAFVLRTYGQWWQECPSARKRFRHQRGSSQDFVELQYDKSVVPTSIHIYETYHPGAVVKILACNADPKEKTMKQSGEVEWVTLWSGQSQCHSIPKESRVFSPPINKIESATNLIRLEFNSEDCEYYTELDAVKLVGVIPKSVKTTRDRREGFQVSLTTKLIKQLSLSDRQTSVSSEDDHDDFEKWGYFGILPDEVIQHIFQYLDKVSLAKVAQTCSLLLKNSYDPLLYCELDHQSYWNTVDDVALESITSRCSNLQHLNLSWTGGGGQVTEAVFCSFIKECGQTLLTLRLACCQYIKYSAMATICETCSKLEELDLSCVRIKEKSLLLVTQLTQLKYLNLYSITLSPSILQAISKLSCLEHLNLGACATTTFGTDTMQLETALNDCLKGLHKLISLDLWRCKFASLETLNVLANHCQDLQELDIGWCHKISREFWDPTDFLSKCFKLKKLFLTCGRGISDYHLEEIAKHCHELEQLDILGTNKVTPQGVSKICKECQKLTFFDVSFCSNISEEDIKNLIRLFPKVCFKKSFN